MENIYKNTIIKPIIVLILIIPCCSFTETFHNTNLEYAHHRYFRLGYYSKNALGVSSDIKDRYTSHFNLVFEQEGYLFIKQSLGVKLWIFELDAGAAFFHGTFQDVHNRFLPGGRIYIGNGKNLQFHVQYYGDGVMNTVDTKLILGSKKKQILMGVGSPLHRMFNNYWISTFDFHQMYKQMKLIGYVGFNYVMKYFDILATYGSYTYMVGLPLPDRMSNSRTFEDFFYLFDLGLNNIRFHPRVSAGITVSLPIYRDGYYDTDDSDDYSRFPDEVPNVEKRMGIILRSVIRVNILK